MIAIVSIAAFAVAAVVLWLLLRSPVGARLVADPSDERWHEQPTPTFGGMSLVDGALQTVTRLPDGGVVFFAPGGVSVAQEDKGDAMFVPAWIEMRPGHPIALLSVTGGRVIADQTATKRMQLGGVEINDMPIAFADVHPFRKLDLMDRPALLLGMDVLRLFERISVDFANRRVRLLAPPRSERSSATRYAWGRGMSPPL